MSSDQLFASFPSACLAARLVEMVVLLMASYLRGIMRICSLSSCLAVGHRPLPPLLVAGLGFWEAAAFEVMLRGRSSIVPSVQLILGLKVVSQGKPKIVRSSPKLVR